MTITDHEKQVITFDQVAQVHENLVNFGDKLRIVFQKVQDKSTSDNERSRIFGKIKAKLDEEVSKVHDIKKAMSEAQKNLTIDRKAEMDHWKAKMNEEEDERKR